MSKLYEIPEDIAKVLRNAGVTVVTKHYIGNWDEADVDYPDEATYTEPAEPVVTKQRKKRKKPKPYSRHIVELGQYTPEELGLRRGRRFYGDMAQRILMHHQRGIKRHVLLNTMSRMAKYRDGDTRHSIGCQITNLVRLGVLSHKAKDNG